MNKVNTLYKLILFLTAIVAGLNAHAQINWLTAKEVKESVYVVTDRSSYSVEETIRVRVFNTSPDEVKAIEWSKVIYVELITPDGTPIAQKKFSFGKDGGFGELTVPRLAKTGTYYLKAYTKWMRNFEVTGYGFVPVKIINPYKPDLLLSDSKESIDFEIKEQAHKDISGITINTIKKAFSRRENIEVNIANTRSEGLTTTVSIYKKEAHNKQELVSLVEQDRREFKPEFYPETRGVSISGKVISALDSTPLAFNPVNLTIFDVNNQLYSVRTDKKGRFIVSFPFIEGESELFITTLKPSIEIEPVILIDNDFCTRNISLPFIPFSPSENELAIYNQMAINQQLSSYYKSETLTETDTITSNSVAFYGTPEYKVRLSDFIDLPSLNDYVLELMPNVGVRKNQGMKYLKVMGLYSELNIYEPLVLLDLVAVYDVDRILTIPPKNIERIEVVDLPYQRGEELYGGIVSFISKEGDLAGVELPDWGSFIKYGLFASDQNKQFVSMPSGRIPNVQNTLFWDSNVSIPSAQSNKINVYAPDIPGVYIIELNGIDSNGLPFRVQKEFQVK